MFAGRFLTGHSAGSNLVSSPIFVSEISHPDMRGTTSVMTMVCYTSGFFLSMLAHSVVYWGVWGGQLIWPFFRLNPLNMIDDDQK